MADQARRGARRAEALPQLIFTAPVSGNPEGFVVTATAQVQRTYAAAIAAGLLIPVEETTTEATAKAETKAAPASKEG